MGINVEKLKYLLFFMDEYISQFVDSVLSDSKTDPHYSAVAATNCIKCYIEIMTELGKELPYHNVEEYFDFNGYTQAEYTAFEDRRQKESKYYRGVQY